MTLLWTWPGRILILLLCGLTALVVLALLVIDQIRFQTGRTLKQGTALLRQKGTVTVEHTHYITLRARLRKTLELLRCAATYWSSDNSSNTGAALAFYCAFSIAPLLVILLTLLGLFVNERDAAQQVNAQLSSLFGPFTAHVLLAAAHSSQKVEGVTAAIVSIVTLLIGATTVLACLQTALELIWGGQRAQISGVRSWIRTRLLSLGFILTLGFLLLISMTLSAALSNLQSRFATAHPGLVTLTAAADFLLSLLLVSGLFALIYRYMPSRRLPWRMVIRGGLVTAILFDLVPSQESFSASLG